MPADGTALTWDWCRRKNNEILMPDLSLDLRYLRYALAVAEQGSFRRAANKLEVPQSTVSRRVKSLEAQIGVLLFRRDHTGVQLTPAGRRFLDEATIGARYFSNAVNAMRSVRQGNGGELRVGLFTSLATGFLEALFRRYRERFGRINIRFEESTTQASIAGVLDGRLDLAFVTGEPNFPACDTLNLWDEGLYLALPEGHPLAQASDINVVTLRSQRFIVTSAGRGPEIEDYLVARLAGPGFHPDIQLHAVSRETLLSMVAIGYGIALVTESVVETKFRNVVFRRVPLRPSSIPASALWLSANANPALKPLLRLAQTLTRNSDGNQR